MDLREQRAEFPSTDVRRFVGRMNRLVSDVRAAMARPEILDERTIEGLQGMIEAIADLLDAGGEDRASAVAGDLRALAERLEEVPVGREVTERISDLLRKLLDG